MKSACSCSEPCPPPRASTSSIWSCPRTPPLRPCSGGWPPSTPSRADPGTRVPWPSISRPRDSTASWPRRRGGAPAAGRRRRGNAKITTGVRTEAVPIDEVMELVADPGAGGTVVFVGTVREQSEGWGEVDQLSYSIYREMAERCCARWPKRQRAVAAQRGLHPAPDGRPARRRADGHHRLLGPHRQEAFEAARYGDRRGKAPGAGVEERDRAGRRPLDRQRERSEPAEHAEVPT